MAALQLGALSEADRTVSLRAVGGLPLVKDVQVNFTTQTIPSAATFAWLFVDRSRILGTKARALVRFEMSLDGGKTWGGVHRVESRDKFKEPAIEYPLALEMWIDGVDETPPGMSKDSGFGVELPPVPLLIRAMAKTDTDADIGVYFKFDDPPKRVWADLTPKGK